jgi:PKD repeat protein
MLIGSIPVAGFDFNNACAIDSAVNFHDRSATMVGTTNRWYWDLGDGTVFIIIVAFQNLCNPRFQKVKLAVSSLEGCVSDTTDHIVQVYPKPVLDFAAASACINASVTLNSIESPGAPTQQRQWLFHDNSVAFSKTTSHFYNKDGVFPVQLFGISAAGCHSDTVTRNITIYATHAFAGYDTVAVRDQPMRLVRTRRY